MKTIIIVDVDDSVIVSQTVEDNDADSFARSAIKRHYRGGSVVVWRENTPSDIMVGIVSHGGRMLGSVVVADSEVCSQRTLHQLLTARNPG
ncbi:MAG: hypothetical protein E6R04_03130 [Spirochaetes bacterium]|nr:MAG: hypothetical protein E6R04_03130 [Spirochaetota bacterium]